MNFSFDNVNKIENKKSTKIAKQDTKIVSNKKEEDDWESF